MTSIVSRLLNNKKGIGGLSFVDLIIVIIYFIIMLIFFTLLTFTANSKDVQTNSHYIFTTATYDTMAFANEIVVIDGKELLVQEALAIAYEMQPATRSQILNDVKKAGQERLRRSVSEDSCSFIFFKNANAWDAAIEEGDGAVCDKVRSTVMSALDQEVIEQVVAIEIPLRDTSAAGNVKKAKLVLLPDLTENDVESIANYGSWQQCEEVDR